MKKNGVVRTTCAICLADCGVLVHLRDGKIVKIEGDPDAPLNQGALCPKGLASLEFLNHPNRLKHPLRRKGSRGNGKWQKISWDEALGTLADKMNRAKETYGPETVLWLRGAARGIQDNLFTRLANAFGSPNITSMAYVCYHPKVNAMKLTFGTFLMQDYDHPPSLIVVWGNDPQATSTPIYESIRRALGKGSKMIVIDPFETNLAKNADLWVRPRPSTDMALALGMINVIIDEELFDGDFVKNWTIGFDELKTHAREYSVEKVEEFTWVPAENIRKAARLFAKTKPAVIQIGNADEQNMLAFQTQRAIYILEAICGNIGVPGGEVQWTNPPIASRNSPSFTLQDNIPKERRERRLGTEYLAQFVHYALPQRIVKALVEERPYMPRVAYIQGANLLNTWSNAHETLEAFKKLEFIAASDFFMTPTIQLCDILFPVAHYLEHDGIRHSPELPFLAQVQQKVIDGGDCWSDCRILIELSKKLGLAKYFWKDEYEFMEEMLKPSGITFDEFRDVHVLGAMKEYRHYRANGFNTPSSKAELYSSYLKKWGYDPLPTYREPPETPYSEPELAEKYPLIFTTRKPAVFRHSNFRQIESLREQRPDPILNIHPETARKLGIEDGDCVYIENKRGRITHKAELTESLDPRVVVGDHGWWYPEQGLENLHGFSRSNINVLTNNNPPFSPEMGTPTFRGMFCRVYKA
jgi:anaerobic selenocysteine-containing dehydrogenase